MESASSPASSHDAVARALARQVATHSNATDAVLQARDGSVLLMRGDFPAYDGPLEYGPWMRLGLSVGPASRLRLTSSSVTIDGCWNPGSFCLTLPHRHGKCSTGPMRMLGLAVNLEQREQAGWPVPSAHQLARVASRLHRDRLIGMVLTAMWQTALEQGIDSPFVEHGTQVILNRLGTLDAGTPARTSAIRPLSRRQLHRLQEWIDSHIGSDISVTRMAEQAHCSPGRFSKAFALATGHTPYAWLMHRRIDHAKSLLQQHHGVTGVAMQVGYSNPSKFSAAFRRVTGVAPRDWIAECR